MSSTKTTSEQITEYYQKHSLPQHVIDAKEAAYNAAMANRTPSFLSGRTPTSVAPVPAFGRPGALPGPAARPGALPGPGARPGALPGPAPILALRAPEPEPDLPDPVTCNQQDIDELCRLRIYTHQDAQSWIKKNSNKRDSETARIIALINNCKREGKYCAPLALNAPVTTGAAAAEMYAALYDE